MTRSPRKINGEMGTSKFQVRFFPRTLIESLMLKLKALKSKASENRIINLHETVYFHQQSLRQTFIESSEY